jgi:hypothetical protein
MIIEKIPVLRGIVQVQRMLRANCDEVEEKLKNGGGEKLKAACQARRARVAQ